MSAELLLANFDGRLYELRIIPAAEETRVCLRLEYWDAEDEKKQVVLEFSEVAAVGFSLNFPDNPIGAELFGLYEWTDEEEKKTLLQENFDRRRREFVKACYDFQENDPHDMLNNTEPLDRLCLKDYHLYEQQTQGGVYRILARSWHLEEAHGPLAL